MNDKLDQWIFFTAIIAGMLLGAIFTFQINTQAWEMEAVRNGHATWATKHNGAAYFKWKETNK
jgi:hypothetical protein